MCYNSRGLEDCANAYEHQDECSGCRDKDKTADRSKEAFKEVLDILFGKVEYNEDKLYEFLDETAFFLGISLVKEKYEDIRIFGKMKLKKEAITSIEKMQQYLYKMDLNK